MVNVGLGLFVVFTLVGCRTAHRLTINFVVTDNLEKPFAVDCLEAREFGKVLKSGGSYRPERAYTATVEPVRGKGSVSFKLPRGPIVCAVSRLPMVVRIGGASSEVFELTGDADIDVTFSRLSQGFYRTENPAGKPIKLYSPSESDRLMQLPLRRARLGKLSLRF